MKYKLSHVVMLSALVFVVANCAIAAETTITLPSADENGKLTFETLTAPLANQDESQDVSAHKMVWLLRMEGAARKTEFMPLEFEIQSNCKAMGTRIAADIKKTLHEKRRWSCTSVPGALR